jgi:hypothetical protein
MPRADQAPLKNTTVFLPYPSTVLLYTLSTFPIHPRVRLRLGDRYEHDRVTPQQLNDLLLGFRFPVRLQPPCSLLKLESDNESFATNPSFTSLTISTHSSLLSTKMLKSISRNKNMAQLVVDCQDSCGLISIPSVMKTVSCHVLQGSRNLKSLTLVSKHRNNMAEPLKGFPEALEQLGKDLDLASHQGHCIAKFHWSFPKSQRMPPLVSNRWWDSEFSPTLVLNCLHRQPGGCPPTRLLGLAIRRINQGILFEYATDLVPWDLSASNASAISEILYDWVRKRAGE